MSRRVLEMVLVLSFVLQFISAGPLGAGEGVHPSGRVWAGQESERMGRDEAMGIWGSETDIASGQGIGASVAAGDLDGDGRDDIVIGAPDSNLGSGGGIVMVFFARDPDEMFTMMGQRDADLILYGTTRNDKFGAEVLAVDMDGDMREELVISAPFADGDQDGRRDSGEVYIIEGQSRTSLGTRKQIVDVPLYGHIYGRDPGDHLGVKLEAADLDGDSVPDLVIGSEGSGGKIETQSEFENEAIGSWEIEVLKGSASGLGTIDLYATGSAVRYFGSIVGSRYAQHIGNGIAVGDFDGDGWSDLAFSYRWGQNGKACVLKGGPGYPGVPSGSTVTVEAVSGFNPDIVLDLGTYANPETSLSLGDMDGDLRMELVAGFPYAPGIGPSDDYAGQIDIFSGVEVPTPLAMDRSDATTKIVGDDSSDNLGITLFMIDQDGNGLRELVAGANGSDGASNLFPDSGEGFVFEGSVLISGTADTSDAARRIVGPSSFSGAFLAGSALDFNGDGADELLVSAPSARSGTEEESRGLVSLFMKGKSMDGQFIGSYKGSKFGASTVMEDFDRDGYVDIAIGGPLGGDMSQGEAFLFFGDAQGWGGRYFAATDADITYFRTDIGSEGSELGRTMVSGDLNNDGFPDLAVGMPMFYIQAGFYTDGGIVGIYWGGSKAYMANRQSKLITGYLVERAGTSMSVGDFNGDDIDDLAIGAPYDVGDYGLGRYHAGLVYIFFGPISTSQETTRQADVRLVGTQDNELAGESLASGDLDGDGFDELIIGAPHSDAGSIVDQGAVYIMRGRGSWPSVLDIGTGYGSRVLGSWPYDSFGSSIECADLDDDGLEDLMSGASESDGFDRLYQNAGSVFILFGSYLSRSLTGSTIMVRTDSNMTVHGDQPGQRLGAGLSAGDLDLDGSSEVMIGSPGWTDPVSQMRTGCVHVLLNPMVSEGLIMNSTSLPAISGLPSGAGGGATVTTGDITGDGKADILMGAPDDDPFATGDFPGSVYFWEGKDLNYRNPRSSAIRFVGAVMEEVDGLMLPVLSAKEGPYVLSVSAKEVSGAENIFSISVEAYSNSGPGMAAFIFNNSRDDFTMVATGPFAGGPTLDVTRSTARSDGFQTYFVSFSVSFDWRMPQPDLILTRVQSVSGMHVNYYNQEFILDRNLSLSPTDYEVRVPEGPYAGGWLNASSVISISNLSLLHARSREPVSANAAEGLLLGLYGPSGLPVGPFEFKEGHFFLNWTSPGSDLDGKGLPFHIGPAFLPLEAEWAGNLTIDLTIDTYAPVAVQTFELLPDGREKGKVKEDDDRLCEVRFDKVVDRGSSGISMYSLEVRDLEGALAQHVPSIEPGDLVTFDQGDWNVSLRAVDAAGNKGPAEHRSYLVDITAPSFSDPTPSPGVWLNESFFRMSVRVSDQGSDLDPTSFRYRVFRGDVDVLTDWYRVVSFHRSGSGYILNATPPKFESGGNYIQWSCMDNVGLTSISQPFPFDVDLTPPTIRPLDSGPMLRMSGPFSIGCQLEDMLSGLDLSSLSYRMAIVSSFFLSSWRGTDLSGSALITVHSQYVVPDFIGKGYLQWRVSDRSGNVVESGLIPLQIDGELPTFRSFEPNGTAPLTQRNTEVVAYIYDGGSGLSQSGVEVSSSTISGWVVYGVGGFSPWTKVESIEDLGLGTFKALSTVMLDEGPFNLIRFRAQDAAGNGWVVSTTLRLEVLAPDLDLQPVALFQVLPVGDTFRTDEVITLDASASYDPEGSNLTYEWYSDIEGFPTVGRLGMGRVLNITLRTEGVHSLYLVVSDGTYRVESERLKVMVVASEAIGPPASEEETVYDLLKDSFLLILVALLLGLLVGGVIISLVPRRKVERPQPMEARPVGSVVEIDQGLPKCPGCASEVRPSDEYCMKCGRVFTPEDREDMASGRSKHRDKLGKVHRSKGLPPTDEEEEGEGPRPEPPAETEEPWGVGVEDQGVPRPENGEEVLDEEVEELEELDEMEEGPDLDDEELEWEVGK